MGVRTDHDDAGTGDVERRLRRAKRPVTALAGPYGHPLHPVLVTVPIGAWVASLVFDLASHEADDAAAFAIGAYWLVALGVAGALLAASIGALDLLAVPGGTRAFRTALLHVGLNLAVVALFALSLVLRGRPDSGSDPTSAGIVVLSVVALAGLGAAGWLGGRLSFRYGVRVADETTQFEGYLVHQGDD
jgi:uncharacterized membrane protein